MKITAAAKDLQQGYEALRAQALGEIPELTPRGLAVFQRGGLPAWMRACPPTIRPTPAVSSGVSAERNLAGMGVELVQLLTDMVVSSQRRCHA